MAYPENKLWWEWFMDGLSAGLTDKDAMKFAWGKVSGPPLTSWPHLSDTGNPMVEDAA